MSEEAKTARDLVLQAVGRNVLAFQRVELCLKYLVSRYRITTAFPPDVESLNRQLQRAETKTMGLLAGDFFSKVVAIFSAEADPVDPIADEVPPRNMTVGFTVQMDEQARSEWQDRLRALVQERNELVHTSLLSMNLADVESCRAALARLEQQHARIGDASARLIEVIETHQDLAKAMLDHLQSPDFRSNFEQ